LLSDGGPQCNPVLWNWIVTTNTIQIGRMQEICWPAKRIPFTISTRSMRFFLLDKITRWEVGVAAEGLKSIALSEDFFDDHFPRRPVMPGVLILEGMAQLSGLLLEESLHRQYSKSAKAVLTVLERTKFRTLVKPGDTLLYRTEVKSVNEAGGKVKATAARGKMVVTSTEMVFAFKYVDDLLLDEKRRRLMELWMNAG
jgi:3-hydroxyacyl-[acyl-carrier-protein] dehydratase